MPRLHVAIIDAHAGRELLAGRKRVESRFSRQRRAPYGQVARGDQVVFKLVGGPLIGQARVARWCQLDHLTPQAVTRLRRRYNSLIRAPDAYWRARAGCRYGMLIWLRGFSRRVPRVAVPRQYGGGWLVLPRGSGGAGGRTGAARHLAGLSRGDILCRLRVAAGRGGQQRTLPVSERCRRSTS